MKDINKIACEHCGRTGHINLSKDTGYLYCVGKESSEKYIAECESCGKEFSVFVDYVNGKIDKIETYPNPNQQ